MNSIDLMDLYAQCNRTRESIGQIVQSAEQVQEISMNASVCASHTGNHIRLFSEIANQIDQAAKRILTLAGHTRNEIDRATNLVLQMVIAQGQLRKYEQALAGISNPRNRQILLAKTQRFHASISDKLRVVLSHLSQALSMAKTLTQLQNRLFAILTAIKVESIALADGELTTIMSLAEILDQCHTDCLERLEGLLSRIGTLRQRLIFILNEEVYQDATRQAV